MPRHGNMPAEVALALHLQKRVKARRTEHLERMGKGLKRRDYLEHVGRAKECDFLLELLAKELRVFDIDGDLDDQQSNTGSSRRTTP